MYQNTVYILFVFGFFLYYVEKNYQRRIMSACGKARGNKFTYIFNAFQYEAMVFLYQMLDMGN